jgi:hypothetical protein
LSEPPSWDELRSDTRFHARGVEPSPLVDLWQRARALPGWFTVDDCGHFALILGLQAAAGLRGDLVEIGCYHGRSAAVLLAFLSPGEALVVCDLFRNHPVAYDDPPTVERLIANLRSVHPQLDPQQLVIHDGASATLSLAGRAVRFAHIDGGHAEEEALGDLRLVAERLCPGGVIAVDDYHHRDFPGVTAAVDRFLVERPELHVAADLHRHGALGRKLYLVRR